MENESSKSPTANAENGHDESSGNMLNYGWAVIAAFGTYFCMYGFRKPFTVATFPEVEYGGVGYKTILVTSQVFGYMLSKLIGIKLVSEVNPRQRAAAILGLIGLAEIALFLYAIIPAPYSAIGLFFNGLPLGMVFGLVLGFLEGRKATEALSAGLCASFILADGAVKSVGAGILQLNVSPEWMPSLAGLVFFPPLLFFVWMLTRIPAPTTADVALRSERTPMFAKDRREFLKRNLFGLAPILLMFLLVTIIRSVRADFAPEIWQGLGYEEEPTIFTRSEFWVAVGVLLINGANIFIVDNRKAFLTGILVAVGGLVLLGLSIIGLRTGTLSGFMFMTLVGLGLYLPYVAVHTTIFERLIALTRDSGNICFLMMVADTLGYLGYVALLFLQDWLSGTGDKLQFFQNLCWAMGTVSIVCMITSWIYYTMGSSRQEVVST